MIPKKLDDPSPTNQAGIMTRLKKEKLKVKQKCSLVFAIDSPQEITKNFFKYELLLFPVHFKFPDQEITNKDIIPFNICSCYNLLLHPVKFQICSFTHHVSIYCAIKDRPQQFLTLMDLKKIWEPHFFDFRYQCVYDFFQKYIQTYDQFYQIKNISEFQKLRENIDKDFSQKMTGEITTKLNCLIIKQKFFFVDSLAPPIFRDSVSIEFSSNLIASLEYTPISLVSKIRSEGIFDIFFENQGWEFFVDLAQSYLYEKKTIDWIHVSLITSSGKIIPCKMKVEFGCDAEKSSLVYGMIILFEII